MALYQPEIIEKLILLITSSPKIYADSIKNHHHHPFPQRGNHFVTHQKPEGSFAQVGAVHNASITTTFTINHQHICATP